MSDTQVPEDDPARLEFLRSLMPPDEWVDGRMIQSQMHRRFGTPHFKVALDHLRLWPGVDFEDRMEGTRHFYWYRLRSASTSLWHEEWL